jgi:hypothetical protein
MFKITGLTLATVALLGGASISAAQTTQDQNVHHPAAPTTAPAAPMPSPGGAAGTMPMMDMGKMMSGDMGQMMPMMQGGGMGMMPFDHIEGRIAFYKAELGITDAQLPQWNALSDALRGSAKGMRTAMTSMMQAGMPATAPARMEAMVQMMSARLDAMKGLLAAEKSLYAVLSDDQKKTADELMAEHLMGMRARGMGAR